MANDLVAFESHTERDRKAFELYRRVIVRDMRLAMADLRTAERMAQQGRKKLIALTRAIEG